MVSEIEGDFRQEWRSAVRRLEAAARAYVGAEVER